MTGAAARTVHGLPERRWDVRSHSHQAELPRFHCFWMMPQQIPVRKSFCLHIILFKHEHWKADYFWCIVSHSQQKGHREQLGNTERGDSVQPPRAFDFLFLLHNQQVIPLTWAQHVPAPLHSSHQRALSVSWFSSNLTKVPYQLGLSLYLSAETSLMLYLISFLWAPWICLPA